jgi:hypothetical protein
MLDLAPAIITYPLLATVYRAPLGEVAALDLSIFLVGPTGAQKSEITSMAQAHYGADFNGKSLPGNWATTANSLEKQAFLTKDAIFTVDDFAPSGTTADVQRLHRDADRLIRGQGNRAGRGRMRPDGTIRPEYFSRGIVVSSGEDIPHGQSLRSRALILEISRGEVDLGRLTALQRDAAQGRPAQAMAAYVQWLAPQIDMLKSQAPNRLRDLRADAREAPFSHDRTPDIVASLSLGWESFLRFAQEHGAISDAERQALWDCGWTALMEAAEAQAGYLRSEEPAARFLALLGAAITSGQAHVADAHTGENPADAGSWGWRRQIRVSGQQEHDEWRASGALVGWLEGDNLYLDPETAYAAAQRLARDQGGSLSVQQQTLWKRMAEQGLLASREARRGSRNKTRKTIGGKRPYVIHLLASTLSPISGPSGPIGPHPSNSAGSRADNLGHFSEVGEKVAHENGPEPKENGASGPNGPLGPHREHKGPPPEHLFAEASEEGEI